MSFSSDNVAVFLAVLDHGSFSAAARALGKVPSAVSMTIANLEAALDLALFDRTSREPVPTAAARALEPRARQIALQLRQLDVHALALHAGLEKTLAIAVAPELLAAPWSTPLQTLAHEFPALEVSIVSAPQAHAMRMLHEGAVQLALVFERPGLDAREGFQEVSSELLVAVVSPDHPLYQPDQSCVSHEDLIAGRQIAVASQADSRLNNRTLVSRTTWRTDSHLATLGLVQAGLGWAYLPRALVLPLLATGALVEIVLENMSNEIRLWADIVWSTERPLGLAARRYVELMREARSTLGSLPA
jgi:DNA-binding transcriptional LysR family regulator